MAFQPLTKEQYDSAIKAGFSQQQIVQNELKRKNETTATAPKEGMIDSALKTLLVKPAVRLGQAVGTPIAKALGATDAGIARAQNESVTVPFLKSQYGGREITVEPQKAIGQGGGTQIFSDALKSASYLAPYGKIAGATTGLAGNFVGNGTARILGGVVSGGAGGYAQDVSSGLDKGDGGKAFIPGFATLLGATTGGLLEAGGVGLEKITQHSQELGKELEQQSFKLTPNQKSKLGPKLDQLTEFSSKNIPAGTPQQRYAYADDLTEHYEEQLQKFLDTQAKTGQNVNKQAFIDQMNSIKDSYKYDRDANAIAKQVDEAISTIQTQYPGKTIPVDKLNIFKRSTYQNAYNKAGNKVLDTVEHDIGDIARQSIEKATKGGVIDGKSVGEFNAEYGNLIQLKKLFKVAEGRPELGFTKRITSRIIGGIIGNALGGLPGLVGGELLAEPIANQIAGTAAKTNVARKLMSVQPKQVGSVIQRLRP